MPKYRGEHDPHGDPSMREIQEEEQRLSRVRAEVAELFYSLDVRNFDAEWSAPPHPDDLVDRVSELRKELIDIPIDDQVQSLLDRLDTVEKRVPLAYVHYLIRQVYRYGYRLNTAKGSYSRIEPLREELEQAREEIESAELGFEGQDAIDVLLEEEGWLDCYEKDPAMYKVRRACQELDKEIPKWTFVEDQQLDNAHLSLSGEVREEQYEWWEEGSVNHVAAVRALIEEAEQARDKVNDDEMKRYAQEYTCLFRRCL
jgi:hypothetical protein